MFDYLFPQDFWEGMPQRRSTKGKTLLYFGTFSIIFTAMPLIIGIYWLAPIFTAFGVICLFAFFLMFRKRINAWRNDEGWHCPECNKRIGFSDIGEAFLLCGKMGNLSKTLTAYIECNKKHRTQIDWTSAINVLRNTLYDHIRAAELRASLNKDKEDHQSQEVYRLEQSFVSKSISLYKDSIVDAHLYQDISTLRQNLINYSNRRWTPANREVLYDLLANIIAYIKVKEAYETEDLNSDDNGESSSQSQTIIPLRIYPEQIENFADIALVSQLEVNHLLTSSGYLDRSEEFIQLALEDILYEKMHKKDWGGEINDLYTSNIIYNGQRRAAAFVLKGKGLKVNTMKQKHSGLNGDQSIKLFNSPAELFIFQFVGNVDENVIQGMEFGVQALRHQNKNAWYCILNGQDTARLLYAYGKI